MRAVACLLALSAGIELAVHAYDRPNDLNFTSSQAEEHNCGEACQQMLARTIDADRTVIFGNAEFDWDFYATAANFSGSRPGDVLKLQQQNTSIMDVPPGIAVYLIQYTSIGLNNSLVPATGYIAIPYAATEDNQVRLVAYAHGTIGYLASCAPSSSANLYNYFSWQILTYPGYAVVGTDYAGMGNNYTTHKYVNPRLNSEDVFFSVVAARKAFPGLFTTQWASAGHSQGGGAVWALGENPRLASNASGEYLGGIAIAPAARQVDLLKYASGAQPAVAGYLPLVNYGLSVVPLSHKAQLLSPEAQKRTPLIDELQLCYYAVLGLNQDLPNGGANKDANQTAENMLALKEYQAKYGAAFGRKAKGNLLVIQGLADEGIHPNATVNGYSDSCRAGNSVQLIMYPGLNHDVVIPASAPDWLAWLDEQFKSGGGNAPKCSMETKEPLDSAYLQTGK